MNKRLIYKIQNKNLKLIKYHIFSYICKYMMIDNFENKCDIIIIVYESEILKQPNVK